MKALLWLAIVLQMTLASRVSAKPSVIVQLFDWSFAEISNVLPELAEIGYTHIHLSPVQKSVENGRWWGKYQPLDYRVIEGPMGTREELVTLAEKANELGIKLMADVVINHMAAHPHVEVKRGRLQSVNFADFSKEDFHPYAPIRDWSDELQVRNRWLFGALPDLKTESEPVRRKLRAHLLDLQCCGVGAFRVDSARHIPPEDLKAIFKGVEASSLVVGEIAECSHQVFEPYLKELPEMAFYDFPLLEKLAASLRGDKPMSDLVENGELWQGLPGCASIPFLRNHDLDRGEAHRSEGIQDPRYRLENDAWQIGYVALFGFGRGAPYVFANHPRFKDSLSVSHSFDRDGLKEGIAFFQRQKGRNRHVFWSTNERLAWTLGDDAFVVLNRKPKPSSGPRSFALPSLQPGKYRDVFSDVEAEVSKGVLTLPSLTPMKGYAFEKTSS